MKKERFEEFNKGVGQRVAEVRLEKGLTSEVLAEKADLSTVSMSKVECGKRSFYTTSLYGICETLGVSADYLLGLSPREPDNDIRLMLAKLTPKEKILVEDFIRSIIRTYHE